MTSSTASTQTYDAIVKSHGHDTKKDEKSEEEKLSKLLEKSSVLTAQKEPAAPIALTKEEMSRAYAKKIASATSRKCFEELAQALEKAESASKVANDCMSVMAWAGELEATNRAADAALAFSRARVKVTECVQALMTTVQVEMQRAEANMEPGRRELLLAVDVRKAPNTSPETTPITDKDMQKLVLKHALQNADAKTPEGKMVLARIHADPSFLFESVAEAAQFTVDPKTQSQPAEFVEKYHRLSIVRACCQLDGKSRRRGGAAAE